MLIAYELPRNVLRNEDFIAIGWDPEKIFNKTGIRSRRFTSEGETALDLAELACRKLFSSGADPASIDCLLYCTQSPDFVIPNNVSILQTRLGLSTSIASLDINQGCSGFVYGLSLAKALIDSGQAGRVLLVTAETYTKYIHPKDKSTRSIFGDGAAATLVDRADASGIGPFVFSTDGRGAMNLCVKNMGLRNRGAGANERADVSGNVLSDNHLYMNGPEIFVFTLSEVPLLLERLLHVAGLTMDDIDMFVFHQANAYMLEHLRRKIGIPSERFPVCVADTGNTVSSTIPITLESLIASGRLVKGTRVAMLGFGVGYSCAGTIMNYQPSSI